MPGFHPPTHTVSHWILLNPPLSFILPLSVYFYAACFLKKCARSFRGMGLKLGVVEPNSTASSSRSKISREDPRGMQAPLHVNSFTESPGPKVRCLASGCAFVFCFVFLPHAELLCACQDPALRITHNSNILLETK